MTLRMFGCILIAVVASAQDHQAGRAVNFYSREKEAALGAGLAADLRSRTKAIDSATVLGYVERLGSRLGAQIPGDPVSFTFGVVADHMGGAAAEPAWFPGGYIFVPADLVLQCESEAEFAGMLAHAIAHVAERHGTRLATRGQLMNQASVPLIFMGVWTGSENPLVPAGFAKYYREYELEADRLGVGLAAKAGFDPDALARYIGRTQPSDSPNLERRLENLQQASQGLTTPPVGSDGEFARVQAEVRELVKVPERPRPTLRRPDR